MQTIIALALLSALAIATYLASRIIAGGVSNLRSECQSQAGTFPAVTPGDNQWALVTGIVELSLARAANIVTHNAAAARQLEAADYALHSLLGELSQVMAPAVSSPLAAKVRPVAAPTQMPSAMAA